MPQDVRTTKRVYFLILALNWLAVALPLPIFVLFMQARGINLWQIGLIMGLYSATIVLLELPTGGLADAIGRKRVALLAHGVNILSGLLIFFSFSFWGFLLGSILMGVGRALNSGALDAWYVDSLQTADPDIDLQPALAQANMVTLAALGIGTLAGGALPTLFSDLPSAATSLLSPLSTTLIVSLALKLVLVFVISLTVHEPARSRAEGDEWREGLRSVPGVVQEALALTRSSQLLPWLMGATVIGGFTLAGVETFWQPHFAGILGATAEQSWIFGAVMAISFLAGLGGNALSIPATKRLGRRYELTAGLARAMQSVGLLVMALLQQVLGFSGAFWLYYMGLGMEGSPHETLVNGQIPAERRSAMLSLQSLAGYIGGFSGSILLGAIAESSSVATAWILAAVVSMVSLVFYARVARYQKRSGSENDRAVPLPDSR